MTKKLTYGELSTALRDEMRQGNSLTRVEIAKLGNWDPSFHGPDYGNIYVLVRHACRFLRKHEGLLVGYTKNGVGLGAYGPIDDNPEAVQGTLDGHTKRVHGHMETTLQIANLLEKKDALAEAVRQVTLARESTTDAVIQLAEGAVRLLEEGK